MSAPAANARSPAPVMTIARQASSSSRTARTPSSSSRRSNERALSASGRSRVTRATPSGRVAGRELDEDQGPGVRVVGHRAAPSASPCRVPAGPRPRPGQTRTWASDGHPDGMRAGVATRTGPWVARRMPRRAGWRRPPWSGRTPPGPPSRSQACAAAPRGRTPGRRTAAHPELALEAPRLVHRDERIPVPTATSTGQSMRTSSPGPWRSCAATSLAMAGRSRLQAPGPCTGSCRAASSAAQAGSWRSIRTGSNSRRATVARGSRSARPHQHERPEPLRVARREPERGRTAHREAQQVERRQAQRPDEREQVVHQPLVAKAGSGVPARAGMTARIRDIAVERPPQDGQLGCEVRPARRACTVEQDERRSRAIDRVRDVEPVGVDLRHRLALSPPGLWLAHQLGGGRALDPQVPAAVIEERRRLGIALRAGLDAADVQVVVADRHPLRDLALERRDRPVEDRQPELALVPRGTAERVSVRGHSPLPRSSRTATAGPPRAR